MYSRAKLLLIVVLMMCGVSSLASAAESTVAEADTANQQKITDANIDAALKALNNDPNLATERKTNKPHWVGKESKKKQTSDGKKIGWLSDVLKWIGEFFRWIVATGRILVWTVAFIMAAILVVWLLRYLRSGRFDSQKLPAVFPTHVRDLDIRPESLPDDIGAAARTLWQQGAHRESLSLLYRGCLSRLVHSHAVSIKHSSTEGECAALAASKLNSQQHDYVASLIRTWQQAVYGASKPTDDVIENLCSGFSAALDVSTATDTRDPIGAAA